MTDKGDVMISVYDYAHERFGRKEFVSGTYVSPSGALIDPSDVASLVDVSLSGWYTEHKVCARFKRELSKITGRQHVTLTNSGSSANLLAITAAKEKFKGRFVITCATAFPTTIAPIYQNDLLPIFIDIDPLTLSPDLEQLSYVLNRYGDMSAGAILTHTLGFPYDEILVRAMLEDRYLISDTCDALGAEIDYEGVLYPVGMNSDISTISFFPAHQICAAEGGSVLTNDPELHRVIESLSNWGRDCFCAPGQNNTCGKRFEHEWEKMPKGYDHKYTFARLGYNLKMTEMQAALGVSQLARLENFVSKRRINFRYLLGGLKPYEEFLQFVEIPDYSKPSPFGFLITVKKDAPLTANEMILYLEDHKVGTRRLFGGNITRQPAFANLPYISTGSLENSNYLMENAFWIGCQPMLSIEHLDYILCIFADFFKERRLV